MSQRLVRAKAKIRLAGTAFAIPARDELGPRLDAVLSAIYAAYGSGWDAIGGAESSGDDLADEAIWLGRLVCALLSKEPEAAGLLALMLHCEARRPARRRNGEYVPLGRQHVALWSAEMIAEAEQILTRAAEARRPGRFQLEAAIQSVHARRAVAGITDWEAIALLYQGLVAMAPSIGARVGRAAALAEARGPALGLAALDAIPDDPVRSYQPYWALRAHLLKRLGRSAEARPAYQRAIGLSADAAVRRFLAEQSATIEALG
jgi:RNA polymerase sigma-70 factor (ECF subfamily)